MFYSISPYQLISSSRKTNFNDLSKTKASEGQKEIQIRRISETRNNRIADDTFSTCLAAAAVVATFTFDC